MIIMYISVVIPLYNKEKHISRAVNSVLNQTYKNFELIIIDDGSTDGSLAVVEKFDDSRIKVFTFKNNGVSVARNLGIEKAKYSYIAFLDADDEWEENFLLNVKKLIQTYPECGMYATLYKFKNNNKVRYPKLNSSSRYMRTSIRTLKKYLPYIKNSFHYPYNNGRVEGINNKIKVLNRVAYGYRNFSHFKKRILVHFKMKPSELKIS